MSLNKFYTVAANGLKAVAEAIASSTGAADGLKIVSTGSDGRLDLSLMPVGVGIDAKYYPASENLTAGDYVNIWDDVGTARVRKADASNGRAANGFVLVAISSGQNAQVFSQGENTAQTGLSIGQPLFLSATVAGKGTHTPPELSSNVILQELVFATSSTASLFEYDGYSVVL